MKISMNNMSNNYSDLQIRSKETRSTFSTISGSANPNFDQILIQSDPKTIEESSFIDALTSKISKDLSSSAKDISPIKEQVQNHTYHIDASLIASRILLTGEGY